MRPLLPEPASGTITRRSSARWLSHKLVYPKATAHVCKKIVRQGRCLSTPEAIADTIKSKALNVTRVGLASAPLSIWHWHALKAMGLPVGCLDTRHAQTTRRNLIRRLRVSNLGLSSRFRHLGAFFRDQPAYALSRSAMTIFCIFIMACMARSAFLRSGSLR